jgi:transcription antitermination factor NusG
MALRWYVVHAYSNFEHKVKHSLEERIKRFGLQEKFGEVLVPTEEVVEMREGQRRRSERKFYPGYVLVQMELDDETWHLVKEVPKVLGIIGGSADRRRRSPTPRQTPSCSVCRKGPTGRSRRCCSSRAAWCASSTVRSRTSAVSSRK